MLYKLINKQNILLVSLKFVCKFAKNGMECNNKIIFLT